MPIFDKSSCTRFRRPPLGLTSELRRMSLALRTTRPIVVLEGTLLSYFDAESNSSYAEMKHSLTGNHLSPIYPLRMTEARKEFAACYSNNRVPHSRRVGHWIQ